MRKMSIPNLLLLASQLTQSIAIPITTAPIIPAAYPTSLLVFPAAPELVAAAAADVTLLETDADDDRVAVTIAVGEEVTSVAARTVASDSTAEETGVLTMGLETLPEVVVEKKTSPTVLVVPVVAAPAVEFPVAPVPAPDPVVEPPTS